ncbi:MAG TPA: isoprenylcysteine carboxylmethyltransferase family protein [Spirochaetia bacterium]|nr:isoprenylcysteine carboxylmethyltransferase family protein [Spirochaetales bacterium]HRY78771.1 isoprenylcysteine carboxylmethyltransferase family protein [Spirochaetia bacterium]HRZ89147.1 isoprenylcysteine carboxylmethyltransferase family protein [Spirochaetia bacterium]
MPDKTHSHLLVRVLVKAAFVIAVMAALFFGTAGSFRYMNGWIYLGTITITLGTGITLLYRNDKALLEKRINTKEKETKQRFIVIISAILMTAIYAVPGFDFRFGWSGMPVVLVVAGEIVLIVGYYLNLNVMLINSYASRVVEIQDNQKLIDTGLYAIVRHPMYMAISLVYIGTCLVLGSYFALIPCMLMILVLGYRAVNEEKTLMNGLDGYSEYMKKTRYRIIPYIW